MNEIDPLLIRPALYPFLRAIGEPTRWRILRELCKGEPLMVVELAKLLKRPATSISKHLLPLRKLGMVTANRAGMYRIPAAYLISSDELILDFGHCRLRMGGEPH